MVNLERMDPGDLQEKRGRRERLGLRASEAKRENHVVSAHLLPLRWAASQCSRCPLREDPRGPQGRGDYQDLPGLQVKASRENRVHLGLLDLEERRVTRDCRETRAQRASPEPLDCQETLGEMAYLASRGRRVTHATAVHHCLRACQMWWDCLEPKGREGSPDHLALEHQANMVGRASLGHRDLLELKEHRVTKVLLALDFLALRASRDLGGLQAFWVLLDQLDPQDQLGLREKRAPGEKRDPPDHPA